MVRFALDVEPMVHRRNPRATLGIAGGGHFEHSRTGREALTSTRAAQPPGFGLTLPPNGSESDGCATPASTRSGHTPRPHALPTKRPPKGILLARPSDITRVGSATMRARLAALDVPKGKRRRASSRLFSLLRVLLRVLLQSQCPRCVYVPPRLRPRSFPFHSLAAAIPPEEKHPLKNPH